MSQPRYPELVRDALGNALCRGCSEPVPRGLFTWCSPYCYRTRCPYEVNRAVFKRAGGKCEMCGVDSVAELAEYHSREARRGRSLDEWRAWEKNNAPPKYEYHHIIPHSEGGKHVLENIRFLCNPCHVKVTAEWRRAKALAVKSAKQPTLL